MKRSFIRFIQNMIVIALAAYLAQRLSDGQLSYYINRRFYFLTLIGISGLCAMAYTGINALFAKKQNTDQGKVKQNTSIIFLLPVFISILGLSWMVNLGMYLLIFILGLTRLHQREESETREEEEKGSVPAHSLFILAIPLILGVIVPAQSLSTSSLDTRGISLSTPLSIGVQTVEDMDIIADDRTILDWIRIFNYESDLTPYIGEEANLIGFVYHDSRLDADQFMAGRFVITCCVADAFAIGISVNWPESASLSDNSWVQIKGTIDVQEIDGTKVPLIHATSVTQIDEPELPYLYP